MHPSVDKNLSRAKFYLKKGQIDEAIKSCQILLKSYPRNIRVKEFLGKLETENYLDRILNDLSFLYNNSEYEKVYQISQEYLEIYPQNIYFLNFVGIGSLALGNDHLALEVFKKAISLQPDFVDGINNLAITLEKLGELDEAINKYQTVISINPNYYQAYNNLGNVLRKKGDFSRAIQFFYKAISIQPNYPDAHSNLAIILHERGRTNEAIKAYKKVLLFKPECPLTLNSLANVYKDKEKFNEAINFYNQAISFKKDFEMAKAQKFFMFSCICDWESIEHQHSSITKLGTKNQHVTPFSLLFTEDNPQTHKKRSEIFAKSVFLYKSIPINIRTLNSKKRIRIGYFSADFHNHATMILMSKIFNLHDREKFEIYAYSIGPKRDDYMRENLIKSVDVFDDVSQMSDRDIALLARQDEIDIAIDLKGYTHQCRAGIFAFRAAPIQINYLGYPGTMGTDFIDYIIADRIIIPKQLRDCYTEEIIYMPNSYQPNNNDRQISEKKIIKSDVGLPKDSFVFCSFNNNYKITSKEFDIWMNILKKVKGSVLWLLKSNQWAEQNLKKEAQKRGVDSSRLVFANKLPNKEHLARLKLADLFIDTFNVNAHTTASDALWAELPVVTKIGKGFPARVAASLLNAVGLPELITNNEKDYESLILDLAINRVKLLEIKNKLSINRLSYPLFDSEKYTKHLENGYQQVYQNYIDQRKPKTISIDN